MAFAFLSASSPRLYSDCSVTAEAMPEGKGSRSWLIMLRFMGMASVTPSMARNNVQPTSTGQGRWRPAGLAVVAEIINIAEMADTKVLPVE